jgi:hypothetical protein
MDKIELVALIGISEFILKLVFYVLTSIFDLFFATKNRILVIIGAPFAIFGFPFGKFIEISIYMTIAQVYASSGRLFIYLLIAIILVVDFLRFHYKYQKIEDRIRTEGYFYDMGDDNQRWLMNFYFILSLIYFVLILIFPSLKWETFASTLIILLTNLTAIGFIKIIGMIYAISIIFTGLITIFNINKFQKYTDNKHYF